MAIGAGRAARSAALAVADRRRPPAGRRFIVGAIFGTSRCSGRRRRDHVRWRARASARPQRAAPTCAWRSPICTGRARRPRSVVLSLGLGLTVLVAIALVEGQSRREIARAPCPQRAPSFFFIDIQPDQVGRLRPAGRALCPASASLQRVPMLRGRITAINGVPADEAQVRRRRCAGCCEGDRGLTWSATVPPGTRDRRRRMVAGGLSRPAADLPRRRSWPTASASRSATRSPSTCWAARSRPRSPISARSTGARSASISVIFAPGAARGRAADPHRRARTCRQPAKPRC